MSDPSKPFADGTLAASLPVRLIRHGLEIATASVVAMYATIICTQVFYRYVLNSSLIWSEEFVRYGLLWGVMLGAALASDRGAHIALAPLNDIVSPRGRILLTWIVGLLVIVFCAVLIWYGGQYAMRMRAMVSPASHLPMFYVYGAIPVGFALMAFFTLVHLISGTYAVKPSEQSEI